MNPTKRTTELETISARELRQILFHLEDGMTVKELRAKLFDCIEQDEQHVIGFSLATALNVK